MASLCRLPLLMLLPIAALAHHSNAEYDRSIVVELEGEIVEAVWRNPHVGLTLRVVDGAGQAADWTMEAADYTGTMRRGVPDHAFEAGDHVRVAGFGSMRRPHRMLVTNVLLPDRSEVLLVGGTQPRWSQRFVGGGDWLIDAAGAEDAREGGIFRVWTLASTTTPDFASDPPLTAAARRGYDAYDPLEDPALSCEPLGMPRVMTRTGPHPIEFIDRGDTILLRGEYFDIERVIHLGRGPADTEVPFTHLGYSRGEWQGEALVVTTSRVDWPYFDLRGLEGVPQSPAVTFTERFRLGEGGDTLHYDITTTDPATFTGPVVANDYATWRFRPGVRVERYDCRL